MALAMTAAAGFLSTPQGRMLTNAIFSELAGAINPNTVGRFLASRLPGKKNKAKRNAIKRQVLTGGRNANQGAAVAYNYPVRKTAPRFRSAQGKYVIANREFLTEVTGNTVFSIEEFVTQPGLATSFPWLSAIANTHQRYHVKKLVFTYVPLAATSERGRVILAYTIDPLDLLPISKSELFQYPTSSESSVWASNTLNVNVGERNTTLFTRPGAVENTDLKTYDFGKLFVSASNTADDTSKIGEIFVDYEVELHIPKPAKCPASLTEFTISLASELFGTTAGDSVQLTGSNVVAEHVALNDDRLRFEAPGVYIVNMSMTAATAGVITPGSGDLEGTLEVITSNVSATIRQVTFRVNVIANSTVTLTLSGWTSPTLLEVATALFTLDTQTVTV